MTTLTTRAGKGSPLTNNEMDTNLTNLNSDKTEVATLAAAGGAALVGNTPAGSIAATTVQAAINELDTEKAALAGSASQVFSTSTLTAATSISTPSVVTASGALGVTPAAGSNLNVSLSTTGDFAVNTNHLYVDTSTGNVGIGTTGPGNKLEIVDTTTIIDDNTRVNLSVQTSDAMAIDKGGSIGLGGVLTGSARRNFGFIWGRKENATDNNRAGYLSFGTSKNTTPFATEWMRITSTGNVGIGTTNPGYQLHVNTDSAGKPGTGGLWTVVSDERIKKDIVPADLDRCYEIVKQVPLKHFAFAEGVYSDEQISDKHNLGFIAQDVQKVFKNAVSVKPFTLYPDIPDGDEEYEEQEFTIEMVDEITTSIEIRDGKPVQVSKTVQKENKVMLFDDVEVLDEAGNSVMVEDKPLTHRMPRMVTKTRPKFRKEVIEDCLDLNAGQMNAALYGAVQALMLKVESLEAALAIK